MSDRPGNHNIVRTAGLLKALYSNEEAHTDSKDEEEEMETRHSERKHQATTKELLAGAIAPPPRGRKHTPR